MTRQVEELVGVIISAGGVLELHDDMVKYRLPDDIAHLAEEIQEHKAEVIALLSRLGAAVAPFPMCPGCGAYDLYRNGNAGPYECERCGREVEERAARIASFLADLRSPGRVM